MLIAAVFLSFSLPASNAVPAQPSAASPCQKTYTRTHGHVALRSAYRGSQRVVPKRLRTARRIVRCQRSARSRRIMRFHAGRYRRAHAYRRAVAAVTPYRSADGRRWAIPVQIVMCESGGSWTAWNPSGARGPYQLLGKPDPWPVKNRWDRLAHHRIAFNLYAGGAGRSHWVC